MRTDAEALDHALDNWVGEPESTTSDYFRDGFYAGLAHARAWNQIDPEDPQTWALPGDVVVIARTNSRFLGPMSWPEGDARRALIALQATHWVTFVGPVP